MTETVHSCEANCPYFAALTDQQKAESKRARLTAESGGEFPGLLSTLCGGCVKARIIALDLDRKIQALLSQAS